MSEEITRANLVLEDRLKGISSAATVTHLKQAAGDIHNILYSAIIKYPDQVNAVEIGLDVETRKRNTRLPDEGTVFGGRFQLERFLASALNLDSSHLPKKISYTFVKNLPYDFDNKPLDHKIRGMGHCDANVKFMVSDQRIPYLHIALDDDALSLYHAHVFPSEIKSIRLVLAQNSDFTQLAESMSGGKYNLFVPRTAEEHYLRFRGFMGLALSKEGIPEIEGRDEIYSITRRMQIPDFTTVGLRSRFGEPLSGFVADVLGSSLTLYEFKKVPQESVNVSPEEYVVFAHALWNHIRNPDPEIAWAYRGRDIVKRLAQIKPQRNNF